MSPRFGVFQKGKVRPIDNFAASYVNDTCGAQEKTSVEGVDAIVKMALRLISRASSA